MERFRRLFWVCLTSLLVACQPANAYRDFRAELYQFFMTLLATLTRQQQHPDPVQEVRPA